MGAFSPLSIVPALIETTCGIWDQYTKRNLRSYCRIETCDDEHTMIAKDASLVTMIRVTGTRNVMGAEEIADIAWKMAAAMNNVVREGHALQIHFTRDPDLALPLVSKAMEPGRSAAVRVGLDIEDLFAERERVLPTWLAGEGLFFVLWTRPSAVDLLERKRAQEANAKRLAKRPPMSNGQDAIVVATRLRTMHGAKVRQFLKELQMNDMDAELVKVHDYLREARGVIYPSMATMRGWRGRLPGDMVSARLPADGRAEDISNLLWPSVASQVLSQSARNLDLRTAEFGDRIFSAVDMSVAPETVESFGSLLGALIPCGTPFRVSFLLEGKGLHHISSLKKLASTFLRWAALDPAHHNKRIHDALTVLKQRDIAGDNIVSLRVSFATWAPAGQEELLRSRASILREAVQGWGNAEADDLVGEPVEHVMSSALGLHCASTAPAGAAPLSEITPMFPWARAGSAWEHGAILFRTPDGRLFPYQPGSSKQNVSVDLVFAPPGRGKSVLINSTALGLVLSEGIGEGRLPRIAIIDIGFSSAGLIDLLKSSLPVDKQHQVLHVALQDTEDHAINPFDTQLGCRHPLPAEKGFLVNLMTLLTTTPEGQIYDGMSNLVSIVIDEAYKHFAENGKPYEPGMDELVDKAIADHRVEIPAIKPTWWEVVDALFDQGLIRAAMRAQTYAVPVLSDLAMVARMDRVAGIFRKTHVGSTQEELIDGFSRMLGGVLRDYKLLTRPTKFEMAGARIVALDLDQVAPPGNDPISQRRTAIMYMMARYVMARDFFQRPDEIDLYPAKYHGFHFKRLMELAEDVKRIIYDEFHRTAGAGSGAVRAQVKDDIRVVRKYGMQITLASQLLQDFDDDMVKQSTGLWILGAGEGIGADEIAKLFQLNSVERWVLSEKLNGPQDGGSPLLAILATKQGRYRQWLFNTLGPIELWALSTTPQDVALRRKMYAAIGSRRARRVLAHRFPQGTAQKYIENKLKTMKRARKFDPDAETSIVDSIVEELLQIDRTLP